MIRWENALARRYYEVRMTRDLFDGWVLVRAWGRIGFPQGAIRSDVFSSEEACTQALERLARRRRTRGYLKRCDE